MEKINNKEKIKDSLNRVYLLHQFEHMETRRRKFHRCIYRPRTFTEIKKELKLGSNL